MSDENAANMAPEEHARVNWKQTAKGAFQIDATFSVDTFEGPADIDYVAKRARELIEAAERELVAAGKTLASD